MSKLLKDCSKPIPPMYPIGDKEYQDYKIAEREWQECEARRSRLDLCCRILDLNNISMELNAEADKYLLKHLKEELEVK